MTNWGSVGTVTKELHSLLSDKRTKELKSRVETMKNQSSRLNQLLAHLIESSAEEQYECITDISGRGNELEAVLKRSIAMVEQQHAQMVVIQELLTKEASKLRSDKSCEEESFRFALEELLSEKTSRSIRNGQGSEKELKADERGSERNDTDITTKNNKDCTASKDDTTTPQNMSLLPGVFDTHSMGTVPPSLLNIKQRELVDLLQRNPVFVRYPLASGPAKRSRLPVFADPHFRISVWGILKRNLGKDLTKVSMPVELNEPISMVQRVVQIVQYRELYAKANNCPDRFLRLGYVAAGLFIVMAHTLPRLRKPFNPLLGETYEIFEDGLKLLVEVVSHHPPICTYYGESDDFIVEGIFNMHVNFSFRGLFLHPKGGVHLTLKKTRETFTLSGPPMQVHNLIIGKMCIYCSGDFVVKNVTTGDTAKIYIHPKGQKPNKDYVAEGQITDSEGQLRYRLEGRSDGFLNAIDTETNRTIELVKKKPDIPDSDRQYFFDQFTLQLNHLTKALAAKLPHTDTRFRPDQRALEHGDFDLAEREKVRLEEAQRARRRALQQDQKVYKPLWFDVEFEKDTVVSSKYKGGYWEARASGNWPERMVDLFG